jgi:hypothetical protein
MPLSRAQYLLSFFEGETDPGLLHRLFHTAPGQQYSPLQKSSPYISGGFAALTAAGAAANIHKTQKIIGGKVQQTSLGNDYTHAKKELGSLRMKHALTLGTSPSLGAKVRAQKARVNDIENRGLAQYHQGHILPPSPPKER